MNAKTVGLGKGLGALIPSNDSVYREILLAQIEVSHLQPRRYFDVDSLTSLANSIKSVGVLQPIVVRAVAGTGRFEIIAGERRWRAAKQAGIATIPAVVKDSDDESSLVNAIIENVHREDLGALEEAAAFQQLKDDFGLTHAQVGERLGKSRATITNALRLLGLPAPVQQLLQRGSLSAGHARALLGTDDQELQNSLANQTVKQNWSVRDVENAVRTASRSADDEISSENGRSNAKKLSQVSSEHATALLETAVLLEELLSTQVSVKMRSGTGQIQIRFAGLEDLTRISAILGVPQT